MTRPLEGVKIVEAATILGAPLESSLAGLGPERLDAPRHEGIV